MEQNTPLFIAFQQGYARRNSNNFSRDWKEFQAGYSHLFNTPAPQDVPVGPWKFEVHSSESNTEAGREFDEFVTISDGKVTLYIDCDEEDTAGEIALCEVLNRYGIKLDYDHEAEFMADFFQKELKRIQEEAQLQNVPSVLPQYARDHGITEEVLQQLVKKASVWTKDIQPHMLKGLYNGWAMGYRAGKEQELKRVQEAQAGVWVKASERVPPELPHVKLVHIQYILGNTRLKTTGYYKGGEWFRQNDKPLGDAPNLEWLNESDSPAPVQVDPVTEDDLQFMRECSVYPHANQSAKILTEDSEGPYLEKEDLQRLSVVLEKYTQSLQDKP